MYRRGCLLECRNALTLLRNAHGASLDDIAMVESTQEDGRWCFLGERQWTSIDTAVIGWE